MATRSKVKPPEDSGTIRVVVIKEPPTGIPPARTIQVNVVRTDPPKFKPKQVHAKEVSANAPSI